jgi:hypothetical protein
MAARRARVTLSRARSATERPPLVVALGHGRLDLEARERLVDSRQRFFGGLQWTRGERSARRAWLRAIRTMDRSFTSN